MRVIGTAGHVDHGKSSLIAALTGTHPDRLKEERAREMTIDLGFASLTLPGGEVLGIVDVPGHRDFIENMLAGVGGIDAALFVVAADEGIMPQTREHLAILDILQVQGGVIALTKADLIDDPAWFELVEADIHQAVAGTVLENAPIVRVSSRSGAGMPELVDTLQRVISGYQPRADLGKPRLPVDRVFTMPGFGTIVTGTLTGGSLSIGEELEILPSRLRGRIRGLQSHNRKETTAFPGSRTAVNISGLDVNQLSRGDTVSKPGIFQATRRLDTDFRLLPDASAPVEHNSEVKLFLGTQEVLARLRLIGVEMLAPGSSGWLQLETENPVVAQRGDRYILRRPSPAETLGGGMVLDPHPTARHKRFSEDVIRQMEAYQQGTPEEVLIQASQAAGALPARDLVKKSGLDKATAAPALSNLAALGQLVVLEAGELQPDADILIANEAWLKSRQDALLRILEVYHQLNPLKIGMPREELKSRLRDDNRVYTGLLKHAVHQELVVDRGTVVHLAQYRVRLTSQQEGHVTHLMAQMAAQPYTPPSVKEIQAQIGTEVLDALLESGKLVKVSPDVVFRSEDFAVMLNWVQESLSGAGTLTVAGFRDRFDTSRKYALAFLEHLDAVGVTVRDGDARKLRKPRG